jgi:hypothetical protein
VKDSSLVAIERPAKSGLQILDLTSLPKNTQAKQSYRQMPNLSALAELLLVSA